MSDEAARLRAALTAYVETMEKGCLESTGRTLEEQVAHFDGMEGFIANPMEATHVRALVALKREIEA